MAYINKDALVAEIEKLKENARMSYSDYAEGRLDVCKELLSIIAILEVKEVDLDEEVDKWYNYKASKEFEDVLYEDIEKCAKHFFELGLKAQKGE